MTDHPITPPPELVRQWMERTEYDEHTWFYESYIAEQAARWGADTELEACCEWLDNGCEVLSIELRRHRRPKPPSLKAQALGALYAIATGADDTREFHQDVETIKSALEQLDD